MRGSLVVTFTAIRLPRFEVQTPARAEFGSRFLLHAHPKNPAKGTKKTVPVLGPKPGKEGWVGGGVQITPP